MGDQTLSIFFSKFAIAIADLSGKPATFVPARDRSRVRSFAIRRRGRSSSTPARPSSFPDGFDLQNSQNRGKALRAKLDEFILTSQAPNKIAGIERIDEQQLGEMSKTLAQKAECVEDVAGEKAEKPLARSDPGLTLYSKPRKLVCFEPFDPDHVVAGFARAN